MSSRSRERSHSYPPKPAAAATPAIRNERRVCFFRKLEASESGRMTSRGCLSLMTGLQHILRFVSRDHRLEIVPPRTDNLNNVNNKKGNVPHRKEEVNKACRLVAAANGSKPR